MSRANFFLSSFFFSHKQILTRMYANEGDYGWIYCNFSMNMEMILLLYSHFFGDSRSCFIQWKTKMYRLIRKHEWNVFFGGLWERSLKRNRGDLAHDLFLSFAKYKTNHNENLESFRLQYADRQDTKLLSGRAAKKIWSSLGFSSSSARQLATDCSN